MKTRLTMLSSMAGKEFEQSLDRHVAWNIKMLDLKDQIFGKGIADLTDEEAARADRLIRSRGLMVYCFSTVLFHMDVEAGEAAFRERYLAKVDRVLQTARVLRPDLIRLLTASTKKRTQVKDSIEYIRGEHPWLFRLYGEAIDRIRAAGFRATIENETGNCILSTPGEVRSFFDALDRRGDVSFTYDVQNLWQMGTFPSIEAYGQVKDLIGYFHLKGGERGEGGTAMRWATALEDASWPVLEITRRAIEDGVSPVMCLNPSHGQRKPGYDYADETERDIAYLRRNISEIE